MTLLRGVPGVRPELTSDEPTAWLERNGGTSVPGKVNYKHLLETMCLFKQERQSSERQRALRIKKANRQFEHLIKQKSPAQMRRELMESKTEVF